MLRPLLPERPAAGHKGTFGHVFIVAGSRGFTGAAKLTCMGAARSGVGLVTAGVPKPVADIVAASLLEPMSFPLPATDAETLSEAALEPALEFAKDKQAVVLGPGLSQHPETRAFVLAFVERCTAPLLVDADGLNCLGADTSVLERAAAPRVLTPHPGEMARLADAPTGGIQHDRETAAIQFAREHNCVLVLKGHRTIVAGPSGEAHVNLTGNSGLASGGTGDVLAGLMGGLMAQGMTGLDAACLGVFLHGLAGDIAAAAMTERAMIAGDLLTYLPAAWRELEPGGRA